MPTPTPTRRAPTSHGRTLARVSMFTGLGVSLAANMAHTWIRPDSIPEKVSWTPEPGAVLAAMFWPIALLLATEILLRKRWPSDRKWILLRVLGLAPVALVAGVISYGHVYALLVHYHESTLGALMGPLSIDGLMLMSAAALLAPDRVTRRTRVAATTKARTRTPRVVAKTRPHLATEAA